MERREPEGEDCLRLNVWTNGTGAGGRRPVMVWLHGGGFATGSGGFIAYDGANLARSQDVVVVTVNHRLNVFGYLYLADVGGAKYAESANVGMRDIIAALQWVHDNIERFGGDPGNVTIFGQSGGGAKVSTLMAMPGARGLFHRAIVESGSTLRGTPKDQATVAAQAFMALVGAKTVDELQQMPMERLRAQAAAGMAEAMRALAAPPARGAGSGPPAFSALALGPVVDGTTLPSHPFDPVAPAVSADVPLLVGSTETEMTFFPGLPLDPIDDAALHARVKQTIGGDDAAADRAIAAHRASRPGVSNIDVALIVASDMFVRPSLHAQADRKAALGKGAVYVYYWTWRSPVRGGKLRSFAHHRDSLRDEQRRRVPGDGRQRRRAARTGGAGERGMGGLRADRQSQPSRAAQLAGVQHQHAADPAVGGAAEGR